MNMDAQVEIMQGGLNSKMSLRS